MGALHTPGPWHSETSEDGHYAIVSQDEIVAEVFYGADGPLGAALFDARLIAAAPELLEALSMASAALSNAAENGFYVGEGVFAKINTAIAKARGDVA